MTLSNRKKWINPLRKLNLIQLESIIRQNTSDGAMPIADDRLYELFKFLKGETKVGAIYAFDIEEYLIRNFIKPLDFIRTYRNPYIGEDDNLQYDPAKNGANLIKHGLAFREAMTYSTRFGVLNAGPVYKIEKTPKVTSDSAQRETYPDEERMVFFSDLTVPSDYKLAIPPANIDFKRTNYTISIVDIEFR